MLDIERGSPLAKRIVVLAGRLATVAYQADIPAGANEAIRTELLR
jgi:hypothetical protein